MTPGKRLAPFERRKVESWSNTTLVDRNYWLGGVRLRPEGNSKRAAVAALALPRAVTALAAMAVLMKRWRRGGEGAERWVRGNKAGDVAVEFTMSSNEDCFKGAWVRAGLKDVFDLAVEGGLRR